MVNIDVADDLAYLPAAARRPRRLPPEPRHSNATTAACNSVTCAARIGGTGRPAAA